MTDTPTEEPPAPPQPPAPPGSGVSTSALIVMGVVTTFAIALTVVFALLANRFKSERDELQDGHADVELAAANFVQALVDYRFDDPASLHDDVVALSADPFTEQFEAGVPDIQALNESLGRVSQATVKDVFVASVSGDEATAIVVYDAVETFTGQDPVPYQNVYVRLGMKRLDGQWKVDDVINLNLALDDGRDAATTPPTATTTPSG